VPNLTDTSRSLAKWEPNLENFAATLPAPPLRSGDGGDDNGGGVGSQRAGEGKGEGVVGARV